MKKVFSLLSFATVLGFLGFSSQSGKIETPWTDKNEKEAYIVKVNAAPGSKKVRKVLNELAYLLPEDSYEIDDVYRHVYSGFSLHATKEAAAVIENIPGVYSVSVQTRYALADSGSSTQTQADTELNKADILANYSVETMRATQEEIQSVLPQEDEAELGKGILIGVIDDGLRLNQVEGTSQREALEGTASGLNAPAFVPLTDTSNVALTEEQALSSIQELGRGTYINSKIPYAYDYGNGDPDVNPNSNPGQGAPEAPGTDENGYPYYSHGTHVASLATANGEDFQGVAPNAQLAMFKIGNDSSGGGLSGDVVTCLDDAIELGCDVVNLSLGVAVVETDDTSLAEALDRCADAGLIVNYAAGNDGKSNYSSGEAYSDWTRDTVNTSMLSQEGLYDEGANIVASTNPEKAFYTSIMTVDGNAVSYDDQVVDRGTTVHFDDPHPLTELLGGESEGEFKFARILGYGTPEDYTAWEQANGVSDLTGYIAVVDRGTTQFAEKTSAAMGANAEALIVINNEPSVTFNMSFDFGALENPTIPVVFVFQTMRDYFTAYDEDGEVLGHQGTLNLYTNTAVEAPDGNVIASYSSDGVPYNLDISPTIAAPGTQVIGAISASATGYYSQIKGYDNMQGTSMATPNFTGALATALSQYAPGNGISTSAADDEAFNEIKAKISKIAMSTADPVNDPTGKTYAAVKLQGAGRVNVQDMLAANSYVTVKDPEDATRFDSKAELKNNGTLKTDLSKEQEAYIEFEYTVHNDSDETRTYTPDITFLIPMLRVQMTQTEYDDNPENQQDIPVNMINEQTVSVNDDEIELDEGHLKQLGSEFTVNAGETVTKSVKLRIDDIQIEKSFVDPDENGSYEVEPFSGTLREYYDKFYNGNGQAGGSFVEGYFELKEKGGDTKKDLNIPYLGFYGDYTKGDAVEPFSFEKEDGRLYNSDMADSYLKGLNSPKPNAYAGSTLTAVSANATTATIKSNINNFNGSAMPSDNAGIYKVNDDNDSTHLYAGAPEKTDKLLAVFYVNRAVASANWSIAPKPGVTASTLSGTITDMTAYNTSYNELTRSVIYPNSADTTGTNPYTIHHGWAEMDISDLPEGDYTLTFTFNYKGMEKQQIKSYTLTVDHTAPELISAEIVENGSLRSLRVRAKGSDLYIQNAAYPGPLTLVEGTTDVYESTFLLSDADFSTGSYYLRLIDKANNETVVLLDLNNLDRILAGSFLENGMSFYLNNTSSAGGQYIYAFGLMDANYLDFIPDEPEAVTILINIGAGQDIAGYSATYENSTGDQTPIELSYDSETGFLSLTISEFDGPSTIITNFNLSSQGTNPPSGDSSNTSSNISSSTPGDSSSSGSQTPSEPQGLEPWAIALIVVGGVVVLGGIGAAVFFLFLKPKKK